MSAGTAVYSMETGPGGTDLLQRPLGVFTGWHRL